MKEIRFAIIKSLGDFFADPGEREGMILRDLPLPEDFRGCQVIARSPEEAAFARRAGFEAAGLEVRQVTTEEFGSSCEEGDRFILLVIREGGGPIWLSGVYSPSEAADARSVGEGSSDFLVFLTMIEIPGPVAQQFADRISAMGAKSFTRIQPEIGWAAAREITAGR